MTAATAATAAPSPDDHPPGRYYRGRDRVQGWLEDGIRNLTCPAGHHIQDGDLVIGEHCMRCKHRDRAGAPECGRLVWLLVNRQTEATYAAEVDWADIKQLHEMPSVLARLRYLGAPLWPRIARRRST